MSPIPSPQVTAGSWADLLALAPLLSAVITSTATTVGVYIALRGLNKWRDESAGKRKIELAESILVSLYEAREAIRWARSPVGFPGEGRTRPRRPDESETEKERRQKDAWYRPIERLHESGKLLADLHAKKYQAMAWFGKDAAEPFEALKQFHLDIQDAAASLLTYGDSAPPGAIKGWEAIIGWRRQPDEQTVMLDEIVGEFERIFGSWLAGSSRPARRTPVTREANVQSSAGQKTSAGLDPDAVLLPAC